MFNTRTGKSKHKNVLIFFFFDLTFIVLPYPAPFYGFMKKASSDAFFYCLIVCINWL